MESSLEAYDVLIKVLIVGDSGVGKSNILLRLTEERFNPSHISTIGLDVRTKIFIINDSRVKLQIWDTAGQESFKSITKIFYRGAHCIFLAYDITRLETFTNLNTWYNEVMA